MRAVVFTGSGETRLVEAAIPVPAAGQLRVRVEGCGVCASNIPVFEGREWFQYPQEPGTPGHEGWGVVDAVGEGVEGFTPGDRVAMLSYHAYAEYDVADASATVRLPDELSRQPFPAEPLACAINIFRRSGIEAGQTVAVIGIGFLGALLTGLAKAAGARVIAISRRPFSLDVARRYGADEVIEMKDHAQIIEQVKALTGGECCERVIECVGKQWPLDVAAELARVRGRLVVAGYHQDGPRTVNMQLWNWRGLDVINAHERDPEVYLRGMQEAVEAVMNGRLDPTPLYTHTFSLEETAEALRTTQERPDGFMKAIIRM